MTFSTIGSVKADYTFDYDDTYFDYGVSEGDIFEYDFLYDIDFTASSTFYDEMDTWIVDMAAEDNVTLIDFSLENITVDVETFLNLDYALQLEITEMYSEKNSYTYYDDSSYERYHDIFNASVRADLKEGNGWETPEVIAVEKLEESKTIMVDYLNDTQYAEFEDEMDYLIDEVENTTNQPDWDNFKIYEISSNRFDYYPNGTLEEDIPAELANGTTEPAIPFPEFGGPDGVPFFFPINMSFEEYYDYATDMFEFELLYNIENNYSIDPFVSTDTLQSIIADGGVSQIYVDEKSIGILWDIGNVDPDLLEEAWGENYTDDLANAGIDDYVGTIAFAAEYDENWALNTFAIYAHIGITLDTDTIPDAPNLNNEDISIDITYTISREGVNPPSEENIESGQIGENSPFEIPGFPIWVIGLFGIISIAALVVKHRK